MPTAQPVEDGLGPRAGPGASPHRLSEALVQPAVAGWRQWHDVPGDLTSATIWA